MIDLHTHSTASDGSITPSGLIPIALKRKLSAIALTDHDTTAGLAEFMQAGEGKIITVPGIEISTWLFSREIHILGLFIDPESEALKELLIHQRHSRKVRNAAIIHKLRTAGYNITMNDVVEAAGGESIGRPHIASAMVAKGYFETVQEVFDALLKRGCSAYVYRNLPTPETAIAAIHAAGGASVWAHAVSGHRGERSMLRKFLRCMKPWGLDGVETRYPTFSPEQSKMMEEMAINFELVRSGGSDFHGRNQPLIHLGTGSGKLFVPDEYLYEIQSAAMANKSKSTQETVP